jgi:hypothetical protein
MFFPQSNGPRFTIFAKFNHANARVINERASLMLLLNFSSKVHLPQLFSHKDEKFAFIYNNMVSSENESWTVMERIWFL